MDAAHGKKLQVKECGFCKDFRQMKILSRERDMEWRKNENRSFDLKDEYKVCLMQRTVRLWRHGTPRKTHAGDYVSKGYKLRFCPECGRRIQGRGKR